MEKAFADKLQGQVLQFKQTTSKGVGDGILKAATTKKAMVGAQCGCLAVVWYQAAPLVFLDLLGFFVHLCFAIKNVLSEHRGGQQCHLPSSNGT